MDHRDETGDGRDGDDTGRAPSQKRFLAGGSGEVLEQTERPVGDARGSRGSLKSIGTAAPGYLHGPHITRDHKARSRLGGAPITAYPATAYIDNRARIR